MPAVEETQSVQTQSSNPSRGTKCSSGLTVKQREAGAKTVLPAQITKSATSIDSITTSYDGEEGEDLQDYRIGGYHPVEVWVLAIL